MPEYLSPGVYVEEVPSGNKPIQGVGTATGAFVGLASKGPIGEPVLIGNRAEFRETFGGFISGAYLAHAVHQFFVNGGTRCYVVRTCAHDYSDPEVPVPLVTTATTSLNNAGDTDMALRVDARSPGSWGENIAVAVNAVDHSKYDLTVYYHGEEVEAYTSLAAAADNEDSAELRVNRFSKYIEATTDPDDATAGLPAPVTRQYLEGGDDGTTDVVDSDFTGDHGLVALEPIDEVNLVAIPDRATRGVVQSGLNFCENRRDCFFIAHASEADDTAAEALAYKQASGSEFSGQSAFNSSYGALYVPWLTVYDPLTRGTTDVPPDGAVAGRYAATDQRRGVHKAPAGIEDGRLRGVLGLVRRMGHAEIETLNPKNVNVLRHVTGVGDVIWGARTLSADPEMRYVGTRRLLLYIEESIAEGTRWVVFEPNTPSLWKSIRRNVSAFLRVVWATGALFGATEEQAFRVKCDAETNPPDSMAQGKVVTEILLAITKPAEFVIFRICQSKAGTVIEE